MNRDLLSIFVIQGWDVWDDRVLGDRIKRSYSARTRVDVHCVCLKF